MRCCVSECKNDSRHLSKTQGITFHAFPTEGAVRSIWLEALGKKNWKPKDRSAVCSDHFTAADFYVTKNGLRKVRAGAIPTLSQLDVCRVCLVMDTKLFSMKSFKLDETYKQLTNLTLPKADCLPHMLCPECAQRLHNYSVLRNRALQAHQILTDIVQSQCHLTLESIKAIDRVSAKLTSSLTAKHIKPDHYDLNTEYTPTQPVTEEEKKTYEPIQQVNIHSEINIEYDVKEEQDFDDENQINHEDDHIDDEKSHIVDEKSVKDDAKCGMNDGQGDEIETNASNIHEEEDNGDTNDDDYTVFANDDDDTSSDSIPIKHLQTVKRKKVSPAKQKKVKKKAVKPIPTEPKIDRRRKPLLNDYLNETLFTVLNLTREEQLAEIVKRKESTNYKNAVYRCGECFKGFLEVEAYNTHMIRHTDQWGTHECDICKTRFKHPHALRKHITAHHTQRFSCNHCPYVTTHRQTARLHERWHKGIKYQCPHCPEEFVKFTTYMGHVRIKHPSDFICELCGYSFVSAKGIELHKKLKHRLDDVQIPDDAPSCELCNVRFISSEALSRHLLRSARHASDDKDPKEKTRKPRKQREARPPANSKRDREETDNSDHEPRRGLYPSQMRKAEGPIPCEQCGIQLEDSRAYHSHFRRSHPDKNRTNYPSMKSPCMCEVCGRMFQSYALLRDHRWLHTGEKPFKCELCSKSFRMKQRLVAHRRVHSAQRATYVCAHCGKHFSTHSNRQRHMFIHTGLKPFKCEMCGKCFKHSSEKRAHITYVHLKKPWPKRARHKRGSQMDMEPPREVENQMWPAACEDKIVDMEVMDDKQGYYHLKI